MNENKSDKLACDSSYEKLKKEDAISIIRSKRKTLAIQVKVGKVIVRAPFYIKDKGIYSFLEAKKDWIDKSLILSSKRQKALDELKPYTQEEINSFAEKAKKYFPERVKYYAEKIGVSCNKITIRCQRTRWGSCSSKGNLSLNCLLILFPKEVIDSVIVHELCHRKHMNHSAKFYAEIEKVYPDYKKCHTWLKENGEVYLNRIPK